jgi:hypothetical protein
MLPSKSSGTSLASSYSLVDYDSYPRTSRSDANTIPSAQVSDLPNVIQQLPTFMQGISVDPEKNVEFQKQAKGGFDSALQFIARNVNPNKTKGALMNVAKGLVGLGPMAMKQNCTYCSKAVDKNLEAIVSGSCDKFWIAKFVDAGTLPQDYSENVVLKKSDKLSDMLASFIGIGKRGIVTAPQKGSNFNHAMNFVHAGGNSMKVIDGQNGKVYDLSDRKQKADFDSKYGYSHEHSFAQFFVTGNAPSPTVTTDRGDWVHVG